MSTAQTAITQYVEAKNGVRFAYRCIGDDKGIPLVMHIHFRANMDLWDPIFVNTLAKARPVIIFDNAGVGRSTGEVPETFQGWADGVVSFVEALGLTKIDLLGFSMGGYTAQMTALTAPDRVRKLVLSGTGSSLPSADHVAGVMWPRDQPPAGAIKALSESKGSEGPQSIAYSFFYDDDQGRAGFKKYWKRLQERTAEPLNLELLDRNGAAKRQMNAALDYSSKKNPRAAFDRLGELKMPVLVANGDNDVLIPTSRSWELYHQIPNAQLILYPRAGHGFIWQYAQLYATHINMFLDGDDFEPYLSKL